MRIIRNYYEQVKLPSVLIDNKVSVFDKHPDIKKEFEYWIENREYIIGDCVEVENYTAKIIAEKFPVLDGEGAFSLLVQLRDNPEKANKRIKRGFIIM